MKCPDIIQLAAYQDGLLGVPDLERYSRHIESCARCQRELHALSQTALMLESLPAPKVPANLWTGVAARLAPMPRRAQIWGWKVTIGAGVAAVLLLGLLALRLRAPLPPAPPEMSDMVAAHQLLSTQDPFADRAGLGVLLAAQRSMP